MALETVWRAAALRNVREQERLIEALPRHAPKWNNQIESLEEWSTSGRHRTEKILITTRQWSGLQRPDQMPRRRPPGLRHWARDFQRPDTQSGRRNHV